MRRDLVHSGCCAPVHQVDDRIHSFGPIRLGHVLLVHHGPRYFEDVPIFALGYTVLLWSVLASEFSPNSFLSEIRREVVREVLLAAI